MNKSTTTATTKTAIQTAAINRGKDKATGEVFYTVKSDSHADTWYTVRWNAQATAWQCNCPSRKPCKHERAVQEVLKVRRARIAEQMGGDMPAIVAETQARDDRRREEQESRESLPLNGTREFSLFR